MTDDSNRRHADRLAELREQIAALRAEEEILRRGFIDGTLDPIGDDHVVVVERKENQRIDSAAMRKNVAEEIWRPYLISSVNDYVTVRKTGE
jgi:hypothetical protein